MHHPADMITHTTVFVTPVVEHWLEREISQWDNEQWSIKCVSFSNTSLSKCFWCFNCLFLLLFVCFVVAWVLFCFFSFSEVFLLFFVFFRLFVWFLWLRFLLLLLFFFFLFFLWGLCVSLLFVCFVIVWVWVFF